MRFTKQIPFNATKALPTNYYLGSSLTKHKGQLSNLQLLFLPLLKSLDSPSLNTRPSSVRLHAHGTRRRSGGHSTRSWSGPRRQGAPFGQRPKARGPAQRRGAPQPTLAVLLGQGTGERFWQ